jgi:hypothetical protein
VWAVRERDEERERVGGGGECCLVWAGWHRARADLRRARGGRPLLSLSSLEAHLRLHFSPARSIPRGPFPSCSLSARPLLVPSVSLRRAREHCSSASVLPAASSRASRPPRTGDGGKTAGAPAQWDRQG